MNMPSVRGRVPCHYCGARWGWTRDHIVPRSVSIPVTYSDRVPNHVWSCYPCNNAKGHGRAACTCQLCRAAWAFYGSPGWRELPAVVPARMVAENPERYAGDMALQDQRDNEYQQKMEIQMVAANANRAARRATGRKQGAVPMVRVMDLTLDEAEVVAEALDAYILANEETFDSRPTPVQAWASERAGAIRDLIQAAVDGKPWHDSSGNRYAPRVEAHQPDFTISVSPESLESESPVASSHG